MKELYAKTLIAFLAAFAFGMFIAKPIIFLAKKTKAEQEILSYVTQHAAKKGTPTFGGFIFVLPAIAVGLAMGGTRNSVALMFILIVFAYTAIGFLDDFIKIRFSRNGGLKAYQKMIFQLAVAGIAAYFAFKNNFIGSAVRLNFGKGYADFGYWYIPFAIFVFVAMSNGVNLTDGLDGLGGTTSSVYLAFFLVIVLIELFDAESVGDVLYAGELGAFSNALAALIGGIAAFLWHNVSRAEIFMGDTGSLPLGAAAAAAALFSRNPLIAALIGIMFVVSCISVIVQVASFKLTGKRVLLMAPFHHHLELKGFKETKIVGIYGIVTVVAGVVALLIL